MSSMKQFYKLLLVLVILFVLAGCAYLGFHGPSIRLYPDIHDGIYKDAECRQCHGPDNYDPSIPKTPHPDFTGCLKCHNDS